MIQQLAEWHVNEIMDMDALTLYAVDRLSNYYVLHPDQFEKEYNEYLEITADYEDEPPTLEDILNER